MHSTSEDTLGLLSLQETSENPVQIAYIKPLFESGGFGYAVHSPDGTQLAIFPSYDSAFFTARQYNLEPVNVH